MVVRCENVSSCKNRKHNLWVAFSNLWILTHTHTPTIHQKECQPETEACVNIFNYVLSLLANEVPACDPFPCRMELWHQRDDVIITIWRKISSHCPDSAKMCPCHEAVMVLARLWFSFSYSFSAISTQQAAFLWPAASQGRANRWALKGNWKWFWFPWLN